VYQILFIKPGYNMKKTTILIIVLSILLSACTKALTPYEAATGNYKKCHPIK